MSERLRFLQEQYREPLLDAFLNDGRNAAFHDDWRLGHSLSNMGTTEAAATEAADIVFSRYRDADPTRTGACTQWLIRLALAGRLPAEDLPKARQTLEAFQTYKRRLQPAARDLGRYETLGAVWAAVEPFVLENATVSGKDEARREREAARAESDILLEQDGWTIAIPKTERAACWWGRGTRWCTAAAKSNMFAHYAKDGPLVVFIRPDGAKFQFHAPSDQFMDAADDEVLPADALAEIPDLSGSARLRALKAALHTDLWHDEDAWLQATSDFGLSFNSVPRKFRTPPVCLAAVERNPTVLSSVPEAMRDHALCLTAVRGDGRSISWVPEAVMDREICLEAVRSKPSVLCRLPRKHLDYELCTLSVANGGPLWPVPEALRDRDMCRHALRHDASEIANVPARLKDRALYLEFVCMGRSNLFRVPGDAVDEELCLTAIENDHLAYGYIPWTMDAPAFRAEALRRNPRVAELLDETALKDAQAILAERRNESANTVLVGVVGEETVPVPA